MSTNETSRARSSYADLMKGLLMFSVVACHCAICMNWMSEPHLGFIPYIMSAWDMPLFMAISGYFFFYSASKRTVRELLSNKLLCILLPCVIWGACMGVLETLTGTHAVNEATGYFALLRYHWFLWSICICITLCLIPDRLRRISPLGAHTAALLMCIGLHLLPNDILPYNNYNAAYMFPFFYAGYVTSQYKLTSRVRPWFVIVCCVALASMQGMAAKGCFADSSVWTSGTSLFGPQGFTRHLQLTIFRMVQAFAGCVSLAALLWYAYRWMRGRGISRVLPVRMAKHYLVRVGEFSLAVYVIHSIVVMVFFQHWMNVLKNSGDLAGAMDLPCSVPLYKWVLLPLASVAVTMVCFGVIYMIPKKTTLSRILLGK